MIFGPPCRSDWIVIQWHDVKRRMLCAYVKLFGQPNNGKLLASFALCECVIRDSTNYIIISAAEIYLWSLRSEPRKRDVPCKRGAWGTGTGDSLPATCLPLISIRAEHSTMITVQPSGSKPNWVAISPSTVLLDACACARLRVCLCVCVCVCTCVHRQNKFSKILEWAYHMHPAKSITVTTAVKNYRSFWTICICWYMLVYVGICWCITL